MMTVRSPQESGERLLAAVAERAQHAWRERLVAAYALGSLAHGGFSAVSDIDVGLVLADPLERQDEERIQGLRSSIVATRQPFSDRLSIFWGSMGTLSGAAQGGRFPPLDRLDLKQFGRLLAGRDMRGELPAPTREELVLAAAEFALSRLATDEVIARLKDPEALTRSDPKTLTKLVLFPVRFLLTARTGEIGRNEQAVKHFAAGPERPAAALARLARCAAQALRPGRGKGSRERAAAAIPRIRLGPRAALEGIWEGRPRGGVRQLAPETHMSVPETNIPCPKCGKKFSVSLSEIVPGGAHACPHCGSLIKFAGQDAAKVKKAIEQLEALGPGVKVNVNVSVKAKRRPWWKFWQ